MSTAYAIQFRNGFVLHPDPFYAPSYRISPFRTEDVARNLHLPASTAAAQALDQRFAARRWCFTECGKEGIALALQALDLKPDDCITILTTTGNLYISGCVTREIEKVCKWSRQMQANTVALFVNHEFGFPYRDLADLRRHGLPIIEDACHSYLADTPGQDMGRVGDFIVFSLPKVYPLQMGGVLSYDPRYEVRSRVSAGGELDRYLGAVMSQHLPQLGQAALDRRANYHALAERFAALGCQPRFELLEHDVPGVFMFSLPAGADPAAMKQHGWAHGIECSVFYGENAFFIPVHQRLCEADLDYFHTVFSTFLERI
jgi:hypothetical protein